MKTTKTPDVGITVPAAAARVGVSELDVRDAVARGDLTARTRIILNASDVDAWAETRTSDVTA